MSSQHFNTRRNHGWSDINLSSAGLSSFFYH